MNWTSKMKVFFPTHKSRNRFCHDPGTFLTASLSSPMTSLGSRLLVWVNWPRLSEGIGLVVPSFPLASSCLIWWKTVVKQVCNKHHRFQLKPFWTSLCVGNCFVCFLQCLFGDLTKPLFNKHGNCFFEFTTLQTSDLAVFFLPVR